MNKFAYFATAALLATAAQAAPTSTETVNTASTQNMPRIGVTANLGMAGAYNSKHIKEDGYKGAEVAVGATSVIPLAHRFSANPSLEFAYRHEGLDIKGTGADIETTVNEMAIEAPLLIRFNVTPGFFLEAGPELGVLLSAKSEVESKVLGVSSTEKKDITDERTRFEIGAGAGLGYQFTENLAMDLRYNYGFRDTDSKSKTDMKPYEFLVGGSYLF